jgi:hypothetical protein
LVFWAFLGDKFIGQAFLSFVSLNCSVLEWLESLLIAHVSSDCLNR